MKKPTSTGTARSNAPIGNDDLLGSLRAAYDAASGEDGWAPLTMFGASLRSLRPTFDARDHGFKKLGDLIEGVGIFEVRKMRGPKDSQAIHWYIRARKRLGE